MKKPSGPVTYTISKGADVMRDTDWMVALVIGAVLVGVFVIHYAWIR